jgi:hypothetical protein
MKLLLLIALYFFSNIVFGQTTADIKRILQNNYPDSLSNNKDWIFYIDKADCEKIDNSTISNYFPQYNLFAVNLTLKIRPDWKCRCIIFFDSTTNDFILQEPLSINGIDSRLTSTLRNLTFTDTSSLYKFIDNFHQIRQIGSQYKFIKRSITDSLLAYYVVRFDDQDYITKPYKETIQTKFDKSQIMGNFYIKIENNKIKDYIEISPNQSLK